MTKNQKMFAGIDALVEAEGIEREFVIAGLEEAVAIACRKYYDVDEVEVSFNYETKRVTIYGEKEVVDMEDIGEHFDSSLHFSLDEAQAIKKTVKVGDRLRYKLKLVPELMERSTIQSAKQVFRQKVREAKYRKIVLDFGDKVGEIVYGNLEEHKDPFFYFSLPGNIDSVLPPKFQVPGEVIEPDKPIMLVLEEIAPQSKKGPKVTVSRSNPMIVKSAISKIVPEIQEGLIDVVSVARDAGDRSKVAVTLVDEDSDLDVIGSCVGPRGQRINEVRRVIGGEHIDLIEYFDDPIIFISNAVAPALVTAVQILDEETRASRVIVPDDQLSLAIGARGQNVRLASKLTGWKIDIKSETDAQAEGIDYEFDII